MDTDLIYRVLECLTNDNDDSIYIIAQRRSEWDEADESDRKTIMSFIALCPRLAYNYADLVIKGRWPEAEPAIAKDAFMSYWYARDVIGGRFPEGETAVASTPHSAYAYAKNVIKGRWPEGEPAIATDPWYSYWYAENVLNGKFELGEPTILGAPECACARYYSELLDRMK